MNSSALLSAVFGKGTQGIVPPEVLDGVLSTLSDRQRAVLEMRFSGLTLEAVGQMLFNTQTGKQGVTKERARQLILGAIRRLRHPTRSKFLRPYLESTSQ